MSPPSGDSSSALSISGASAAAIGSDPSAREPWPRSDFHFNSASVPGSGWRKRPALQPKRSAIRRYRRFSKRLDPTRRAAYQPEDEQQYHRSDEGDEDRAAHAAERRAYAQRAEQPAADECADDPDD